MYAEDTIATLSHCRTVLVRVAAGLEIEDLDYRAFPDAKSNGEILLHIAGFEFLIVASAQSARGENFDTSPWSSLKAGFAREAGFAPPEGRRLDEYLKGLEAARQTTVAYLDRDTRARGIEASSFAIRQVTQELSAIDPEDDESCYRRLAVGISTSFSDDGAPDARGMVDVPSLLALHETYHRGQITLNKYIRSRTLRAAAARSTR